MMKSIKLFFLCLFSVFAVLGCSDYRTVGPDEIGLVLAPTGFENTIYPPGQVDIGDTSEGKGSTLYLVQLTGLDVKESFGKAMQAPPKTEDGKPAEAPDTEDHRCLLGNKSVLTLDLRNLFAFPDYNTAEGRKDLLRAFAMTSAECVNSTNTDNKTDCRVKRISAKTIYDQQARQEVRQDVRRLCASYHDFDEIFEAFKLPKEDAKSLEYKVTQIVAKVMKAKNVPLRLVSASPSNLKEDDEIIRARTLESAAQGQINAMRELVAYLDADKTGARRLVYQYQEMNRIVSQANANGHNTVVLTSGNGPVNFVPLSGSASKEVKADVSAPAKKAEGEKKE